jgi:hypothetical protein
MKAPSRSIGASLRSQRAAPPRGPETIEIGRMKAGGPSMIASGEGRVESPPGRRHARSAHNYADAMRPFGGPSGSG